MRRMKKVLINLRLKLKVKQVLTIRMMGVSQFKVKPLQKKRKIKNLKVKNPKTTLKVKTQWKTEIPNQ